MNEHEWFIDRIAAALAGGLPSDEQSHFDAHCAGCADCAREFAALQQTEQTMTQLFADIVPPSDFEQRLLSRLRFSGVVRLNPIVRRAAVAASVALLLGGFGYVANRQIESGGLDANNLKVASNLRQVGQAIFPYANENKGAYPRTYYTTPAPSAGYSFQIGGGELNHDEDGKRVLHSDGHTEYQQNPFTGIARDSLATRDRFHQIADHNGAASGDDSVLLPKDEDGDGVKDRGVAATTPNNAPDTYYLGRRVTFWDGKPQSAEPPATPALTPAPKAAESGLSGANSFGGSVVAGGTFQLGTQAHPINLGVNRGGGDVTKDSVNGASTNELFYRPNQLASDDVSKSATEREPVRQALEAGKPIELANKTQLADQLVAATDEEKTHTGEVTGKSFVDASAPAAAPADTQSAPTTQAIVRKVIRNGTSNSRSTASTPPTMTVTKIVDRGRRLHRHDQFGQAPQRQSQRHDRRAHTAGSSRHAGDETPGARRSQEPEPHRRGCHQAIHRHRERAPRRPGDAGAIARHHQEKPGPDQRPAGRRERAGDVAREDREARRARFAITTTSSPSRR